MKNKDHTKLNKALSQKDADNPLIQGQSERPVAPLRLTYEARKIYNEIIQSLPVDWYIFADLALFETFCQTKADYDYYQRKIKEGGATYTDSKGIMRAVPWVNMSDKAKQFLMAASGKLKLNVTSRSGTSVKRAAAKAKTADTIAKTGRKKGLMYIVGSEKDGEKPSA